MLFIFNVVRRVARAFSLGRHATYAGSRRRYVTTGRDVTRRLSPAAEDRLRDGAYGCRTAATVAAGGVERAPADIL